MTNRTVHSCDEALRALSEISDRIVVVASPLGSALTTALRQARRDCYYILGSLIDPFDWEHVILKRPFPVLDSGVPALGALGDRTVVFDDADHASDRMLDLAIRSVHDTPGLKIIFRTYLNVPERLAQFPRITLTGSES